MEDVLSQMAEFLTPMADVPAPMVHVSSPMVNFSIPKMSPSHIDLHRNSTQNALIDRFILLMV